ncbi:type IV pilin protein [Inhella proteolytica]|uniref:Prepilin-type N-terminal cleavage/methylation domain-containing protein n=1 Tax=Inhella proteolytica TaxID=2795029 RepID=A0A931J002_9BURK|nr:type IV pilin protein [Inhella proteolytica]MBH9575590.1 hypothetical protein [Inhella proteolytica]
MGGRRNRTSGRVPAGKVLRLCKHVATMPTLRPALGVGGFTLLELVFAVVVAGLLALVAIPSFMDQLRKSRRADAHDHSALITLAQERYRIGHSSFASAIDQLAAEGVSEVSAGGYYVASLVEGTGVGYTLSLKPAAGSKQADDRQCAEFKIVFLRGGLTRTATDAGGVDSSARCWPQ